MIKNLVRFLLLITLLMSVSIATIGCSSPKFELSSFEISPEKMAAGDTATISVDISNTGTKEGTYTAELVIDDISVEARNIALGIEETREVTFKVLKEETGTYNVRIRELYGTLSVVKPAEFQLSSLKVDSDEYMLDDEICVSVNVRNIGEMPGTYECELCLDDKAIESEEIELEGGDVETVSFSLPADNRGTHEITVGELSRSIEILKPADFRCSSFKLSPDEIEAGSSVDVEVVVSNDGDVSGTYSMTLKLDNENIETRNLTLQGGDASKVSFTITCDDIGVHTVKLNTSSGSLKVCPVAPNGYLGFSDWDSGVYVAYPNDWEIILVNSQYYVCMIGGIEDSYGFRPNINIVIEELPYTVSIREYFEAAEVTYGIFNDYRVISTEYMVMNGLEIVRHTFTFSGVVSGVAIPVKMIQVAFIENDAGYILTLTSHRNTFNEHEVTFDTIINSFQALP